MDNTRLPKAPSPTNPEEEGIADAQGNDGKASMPEQVKRPNPCRKMMMMMMMFHCSMKVSNKVCYERGYPSRGLCASTKRKVEAMDQNVWNKASKQEGT